MLARRSTLPRGIWIGGLFVWSVIGLALGAAGAPASPSAAAAGGPTGSSPHPWAISLLGPHAVGPNVHNSHYWAGAYYTGTNRTATQVVTTMTIPDAIPSSSEFYYVLLSVWDSAGSYDQVGFTNDGGVWGWTYSFTTSCAGSYTYNPDAYNLVRGQTYTFAMNISSSGYVVFSAQHNGAYVATHTGHTTGTYFLDQSFYSCGGATYYDLTDYEEAYTTVQLMPSYDYLFARTTQNNVSIRAWSSMGNPPGGGSILVSGTQVEVENEAFAMKFAHTPDNVHLAAGTTTYTANVTIAKVASGTNITLSLLGPTSIFSASFSPSSGAPGFTTSVSLSFPSPVAHTTYALTLEATDGGGAFTYVTLQVTVV